jgi:hypothetical protein
MTSEIIGDKNVFAIEFAIKYEIEYTKNGIVYGGCRLWLKGQYLGDIDNPIYLNMFHKSLKWIGYNFNKGNLIDSIPVLPLTIKEFTQRLDGDETLYENALLEEEAFNRFNERCFRNGENLIFYWCIELYVAEHIESFPEYTDYPKEVQVAEIPISVIKEVADKFEARIAEIIENSTKIKY